MGHDSSGSQYRWYVGRFELIVGFDRRSHKADWVNLSAQPCTPPLTLEEAKEVMSSVGLKNFQPYFDGAAAGTWGQSDGPVHATFRGNDDHLLSIETQLLENSGAFITD
jgi:hypothetical protein